MPYLYTIDFCPYHDNNNVYVLEYPTVLKRHVFNGMLAKVVADLCDETRQPGDETWVLPRGASVEVQEGILQRMVEEYGFSRPRIVLASVIEYDEGSNQKRWLSQASQDILVARGLTETEEVQEEDDDAD